MSTGKYTKEEMKAICETVFKDILIFSVEVEGKDEPLYGLGLSLQEFSEHVEGNSDFCDEKYKIKEHKDLTIKYFSHDDIDDGNIENIEIYDADSLVEEAWIQTDEAGTLFNERYRRYLTISGIEAVLSVIGDNLHSLLMKDFESMDAEKRGYAEGVTFSEFKEGGLTIYASRGGATITIHEGKYDLTLYDREDENALPITSLEGIPKYGLEAIMEEAMKIYKKI